MTSSRIAKSGLPSGPNGLVTRSDVRCCRAVLRRLTRWRGFSTWRGKSFVVPPSGGMVACRLKPVLRTSRRRTGSHRPSYSRPVGTGPTKFLLKVFQFEIEPGSFTACNATLLNPQHAFQFLAWKSILFNFLLKQSPCSVPSGKRVKPGGGG